LKLNWERIFSPSYRKAVSQAVPRAMFANDQGIMFGSGEAWFNSDGKIIAINPCEPNDVRRSCGGTL